METQQEGKTKPGFHFTGTAKQQGIFKSKRGISVIINKLTRDTNKPLINKLAAASEPVRVVGPVVCVVLLFNVLSYWKSKRGRLSGIDQTCVLGHGGSGQSGHYCSSNGARLCVQVGVFNAHPDTRSSPSSCIIGCVRPLTCNLNKRPINRPARPRWMLRPHCPCQVERPAGNFSLSVVYFIFFII